jgi:integrase
MLRRPRAEPDEIIAINTDSVATSNHIIERAHRFEIVSRNVAAALQPPKVKAAEVAILSLPEMGNVLLRLTDPPLYPIAVFALCTGMRQSGYSGWHGAIDLDGAKVRVERSMEETAAGLRFKTPKTNHGRRTVSLPASVVDILRVHRRQAKRTTSATWARRC